MPYEAKQAIRFHDLATGQDMLLNLERTGWYGWLFFRHPGGEWVSQRKATAEDLLALVEKLRPYPDADLHEVES